MAEAQKEPQTPAEKLSEPVAGFVEAQAKEYGTYVANRPIDVGNARAYNAGDPVPVSNVKKYGYDKVAVDGGGTESWVDKV